MKRFLGILIMLLCCASVAFAAITIQQQPETQTVEAGGKVSFSVKASGVGDSGITWHFVNESTGEDVTGRKLADRFKGLKVQNPNNMKITLQNVPEEMHGLTVYCHFGKANSGVDTEKVQLLIAGMEAAEEPSTEETESEESEAPEEAEKSEEAEETEADEEAGNQPQAETVSQSRTSGSSGDPDALVSKVFPQVNGFDPDTASYQYLQLGTYYYDENGGMAPLVWRILYREDNKLTLFTEYVIDAHQMYETDKYYARTEKKKYKNHFNDTYEELGIYFWLNGEMAKTIFSEVDFSSAIIPHKIKETYKNSPDESDVPDWPDEIPIDPDEEVDYEQFPYGKDLFYIMTYGDMKKSWYGFPATYYGDAIEQPGEIAVPEAGRRKTWATPYARAKIQYPQWSQKLRLTVMAEYNGTSPYWAVKRRMNYYMIGIVGGNGHLSWRAMDSVQIGVRPAMRLDLSQLVVTGGSGTMEDPWRMAMAE